MIQVTYVLISYYDESTSIKLTMGVCNSLDIFQEKMNETLTGIEFIRAYINKFLVITKSDWSDPLNKLELVLKNIRANRRR